MVDPNTIVNQQWDHPDYASHLRMLCASGPTTLTSSEPIHSIPSQMTSVKKRCVCVCEYLDGRESCQDVVWCFGGVVSVH